MIDRDEFRQLMGEAAAQSADDPQRRDVERHVSEDEGWSEPEWRELLQENEVLRRELTSVSVPADLEEALLAVTREAAPQRTVVTRNLALAAAVVALVVLGVGLSRHFTMDSRLRTVSLLAINNHLNHLDDHGVHRHTTSRRELEQALTDELSFAVAVPDLSSDLQLIGGRTCKLGTHAVAFSLWEGVDGECSLFQFQPDEFGLPSRMSRSLIHSDQPAAEEHTCGAWIWCEGSRGYVLVGDPGCELENLSFVE